MDDDTDKVRALTQALLAVGGISREDIDTARTLHEAREYLSERAYGLLILDLKVPEHIDSDAEPDGGIRLLQELRANPDRFLMPGHIVGITQYDELLDVGDAEFAKTTHKVLRYSRATSDWRIALTETVQLLLAAEDARGQAPAGHQSKLAVLCALPMELEAIRKLPWGWVEHIEGTDPSIYYRGAYETDAGRSLVYAAAAPRMGMSVAAALATKMILSFRPEYIAMTGIAAGVKEDPVRLGDVLLGDPVWDYGSGKWIENAGKHEFQPDPDQIGVSRAVRSAFERVMGQTTKLDVIRSEWPADPPPHPLRLRIGPIASGAAVLADNQGREEVLRQNRKALGIEMEAYGLYVAAREAPEPTPKPFAIKTVVDFADSRKGDAHQRYGAHVSAQVLQMVAKLLP